jgi:hypothetical protein
MNSIYFFYKIFNFQELILKFNNLHYNNIITLEKCILFKPQPKDNENNLNIISNDLRYIFEFLTNSKVTKSINKKFICFNKVCRTKSFAILSFLSYLIFTRFNIILESSKFDVNFPVIQRKRRYNKILFENVRNCFDIKFNNGVDLAFLSDNEYISYLATNFYIRYIFSKKGKKNSFIYFRQLVYLSLVGNKYCLILKK